MQQKDIISKDKLKSNEDFYNSISVFYDGMVNFSSALLRRKNLLKNLITDKLSTAADLGCGTGMDSISLAMNGINVTGFDSSEEMINKAKENSSNAGYNINFQKFSLDRIPSAFYSKFDLVVSLGNTLANLNEKKLNIAIVKISRLLKQDGKLVIQILNYKKIVKDKVRIVNVNSEGDDLYIRFYDFLPDRINFNILKIHKIDNSKRELYTTVVYPHSKELFLKVLKENNFKHIKFYGGLDLKPYKKNGSSDLVIIAEL